MSLGLSAYDSSSDSCQSEDETKETNGVKCIVSKQKRKILAPKKTTYSSDEEEPLEKRSKNQTQKTGLFAKLPAPRNTIGKGKEANRPLIPHVFRRQVPEVKKVEKIEVKEIKKIEVESESENEDETVSFFSYVDKNEEKDQKMSKSTTDPKPTPTLPIVESTPHIPDPPVHQSNLQTPENVTNIQSTSGIPENFRKDESFLRIQGKKYRNEKIEFVDYNAADVVESNKELLLKSLSEEKNHYQMSHSKKNGNIPSAQHKRKHQLSYLIHQAKEKELELKNAWAAGRVARQVARNRYGF